MRLLADNWSPRKTTKSGREEEVGGRREEGGGRRGCVYVSHIGDGWVLRMVVYVRWTGYEMFVVYGVAFVSS